MVIFHSYVSLPEGSGDFMGFTSCGWLRTPAPVSNYWKRYEMIMTYHMPWLAMTCYDLLWLIMTYHGILWLTMTYHDLSWDGCSNDLPCAIWWQYYLSWEGKLIHLRRQWIWWMVGNWITPLIGRLCIFIGGFAISSISHTPYMYMYIYIYVYVCIYIYVYIDILAIYPYTLVHHDTCGLNQIPATKLWTPWPIEIDDVPMAIAWWFSSSLC